MSAYREWWIVLGVVVGMSAFFLFGLIGDWWIVLGVVVGMGAFFLFGLIGASMAETRHRSRLGGFMVGACLGLLGIGIIALLGEQAQSGRQRGGRDQWETVLMQCKSCDMEWEAWVLDKWTPAQKGAFLDGRGCPECLGEERWAEQASTNAPDSETLTRQALE